MQFSVSSPMYATAASLSAKTAITSPGSSVSSYSTTHTFMCSTPAMSSHHGRQRDEYHLDAILPGTLHMASRLGSGDRVRSMRCNRYRTDTNHAYRARDAVLHAV